MSSWSQDTAAHSRARPQKECPRRASSWASGREQDVGIAGGCEEQRMGFLPVALHAFSKLIIVTSFPGKIMKNQRCAPHLEYLSCALSRRQVNFEGKLIISNFRKIYIEFTWGFEVEQNVYLPTQDRELWGWDEGQEMYWGHRRT